MEDTCALGYLMCCVLRMAVSEASVERVFSVLGWSMDDRKNRTSPINVAASMALRFRNPFESKEPEALSNIPLDLTLLALIARSALQRYKAKENKETARINVDKEEEEKIELCSKCRNVVVGDKFKKCEDCNKIFCKIVDSKKDCGGFGEKSKKCHGCVAAALFGTLG